MLERIASKAAVTIVAVTAVVASLGFVAADAAAAAPHAAAASQAVPHFRCHLRHNANYPPGRCFLRFNKATYHRTSKHHRGDIAKFVSSRTFIPGEKLRVVERCRKGYVNRHKVITRHNRYHVGPKGRARGQFRIRHATPFGRCTVTITGRTSGDQVRGSFRVVRRHH